MTQCMVLMAVQKQSTIHDQLQCAQEHHVRDGVFGLECSAQSINQDMHKLLC